MVKTNAKTSKTKGRQGWNDTVKAIAKSTGAEFNGSPAPKRRDTRKRAAKARKSRWAEDADVDAADINAWARLEAMLEDNDAATRAGAAPAAAEQSDDSYDDDDDGDGDGGGGRRARAKKPRPTKKGRGAGATAADAAADARRERRHRPRSLAQILLDDYAPSRGGAWPPPDPANYADFVTATARPSRRPPSQVCVVTGAPGPYRCPETGQRFADAEAGALLRENPPPWLNLGKHHGAPLYEAMLQIKAERARGPARRAADEVAAAAPRYGPDGYLLAPGQRPGEPDPPGWYRGRKFE